MKQWSVGKIAAFIIGGIAFAVALFISLIASIWFLSDFLYKLTGEEQTEEFYEWEESYEKQNEYESDNEEYYEFANAIRNDLAYGIEIEEFYRDDFSKEGANGDIIVEFTYPVITGEAPNLEAINQAVYAEIEEIQEYVASAGPHLSEGDVYNYSGEVYIPYMSEKILSVMYVEYGYYNGSFLFWEVFF